MSKVLALKKPIRAARHSVAGEKDPDRWIRTITMEIEDLCAELKDTKTVIDVSIEVAEEIGESAAAIGALTMLQYKFQLIERSAQNIKASTKQKGR